MSDPSTPSQAIPRWLSVTGKPLPALQNATTVLGKCRDIRDFDKLNRLGEGTYGVVHRSHDRKTNTIVALKQVRVFETERGNGIPITALREISILKSLRHNNVLSVIDVAVGSDDFDSIYMVTEYAEQDLANLLDHARVRFSESEVKCLMKQLLEGMEYLHRHDIIHRDIKMSNILLTRSGVLKLADFGLAREWSNRPLTPGVVTVWYRSPELLLCATRYTTSVDIWSCGCIMGELLTCSPLLPGETEIAQWQLICSLLGAPTDRIWPRMRSLPGLPDESGKPRPPPVPRTGGNVNNLERKLVGQKKECINLVNELLTYDPEMRPSAYRALRHAYFTKEEPRACRPEMVQTFPEIRNMPGAPGNVELKRAGEQSGYVFDFGGEGGAKRRKK
ncbi:kinase-like domain-containing protein [Pyronema domesticum]|nr:kinase-like domain-containing protein [Pyronema domesticum]